MNILKAAMTVSALTLLSRVTGLLRETLTARMLGAGADTDAFFVAFRIPNLLRRLFAEGAFSQAFVPVLAQVNEQDGIDRTRVLIGHVATCLFWLLGAVSLAGVLGASGLVWVMASGLQSDAQTFDLTVVLTRWMFPYILLISLVALASGVLNTYRHFAVPAFTPVLLNVSFIASVLLVSPLLQQPVYALAAAVIVGGILQLAVQIWAMRRIGIPLGIGLLPGRIKAAWADETVRRIVRQMLPASLAVSVAQVSLIINTQIASHLQAGSVSWISYGDRLMEFPTALLGVALGTVLLPALSRAHAAGQFEQVSRLIDWGLRITVVLAIPAAAGLACFGEPLTALLFHYGKFDAHDVEMTRQTVLGYSVGLLGLVAVKVLAPGFYARQDVRTPVKIGIAVVLATQAMNMLTVPWLGHAGLPLSIGLGAMVNAAVLWWGLRRRGVYQPQPGWVGYLLTVAAATMVMSAALLHVAHGLDWIALGQSPGLRAALVLTVVGFAGALYFGLLALCGLTPRVLLRRPQA